MFQGWLWLRGFALNRRLMQCWSIGVLEKAKALVGTWICSFITPLLQQTFAWWSALLALTRGMSKTEHIYICFELRQSFTTLVAELGLRQRLISALGAVYRFTEPLFILFKFSPTFGTFWDFWFSHLNLVKHIFRVSTTHSPRLVVVAKLWAGSGGLIYPHS